MQIERWLYTLPLRFRSLFRRKSVEQELADEIRDHIERAAAANVARGMTPDNAPAAARRAFGSVESQKEEVRDARKVRVFEDLARDAAYAASGLRRNPGFAATTILTIAIGISATTLVFSAINAIFLRRLAVRDADQVLVVQEIRKGGSNDGDEMARPAYPYEHFVDFAAATRSVFSGVAASTYDMLSVRDGSYAHDVSGVIASSNYFSVLGVQPALGRFFSISDERTGNALPEVVIGFDWWKRTFAGDSSVLGRTIIVDSRPLAVVGIAPKGFEGTLIGLVADLWIPAGVLRQPIASATDSQPPRLRDFNVVMFGRLRPDFSVARASAALAVLGPQVPTEHQMSGKQPIVGVQLDPISGVPAAMRRPVAAFMSMLMLTGVLVLLIAVANVMGMLLARGAYRRKEIALRLALGASRGRLLRQLLTESTLMCALGAIGGLLLSRWLLALLPSALPPAPVKIAFEFTIDPVVLGVTLAVSVLSGIVAGLHPALQSLRTDLVASLHGAAQGHPARVSRARDVFVVGQLALSLVLLITAGLFTRALERATNIDPGLDVKRVLAARIDLSDHGYTRERGEAFYSQLLTRLRARPELAGVTFGIWTPLGTNYNGEGVLLPGEQPPKGKRIGLTYGVVENSYLDVMGVPIVAGRAFSNADAAGTLPVVVVNETFARRFWPGESPLGKTVKIGGTLREVVGVARNGKYRSLDEAPENYAFVPWTQRYNPSVVLFARSRGDSSNVATLIRKEVAALDPNVAVEAAQPLSSQIAVYLWPQQAAAAVIGVFGAVGLLLALVGVYGVVAFHVGQRTREFGVRLALGASRQALVRLVLRRALVLVGVSVAVGAVLALAVTSLAHRFLYGLGAADPLTFAFVSTLLVVVAVTASYLPARRAAKTDPVKALRAE